MSRHQTNNIQNTTTKVSHDRIHSIAFFHSLSNREKGKITTSLKYRTWVQDERFLDVSLQTHFSRSNTFPSFIPFDHQTHTPNQIFFHYQAWILSLSYLFHTSLFSSVLHFFFKSLKERRVERNTKSKRFMIKPNTTLIEPEMHDRRLTEMWTWNVQCKSFDRKTLHILLMCEKQQWNSIDENSLQTN